MFRLERNFGLISDTIQIPLCKGSNRAINMRLITITLYMLTCYMYFHVCFLLCINYTNIHHIFERVKGVS